MSEPLKAPFPYFGGKSRVAGLVWARLGNPDNYVEPFFGSGAMLLSRPEPPRGVETVNDLDCMVANFWRATQADPAAVAAHADGPVNEADLHARHRWLVLSDDAAAFRRRMREDPHYYDAKAAGWWCWGLCCWIGSGWCAGKGVAGRTPKSKARIDGDNPGSRGKGVHAGAGLPRQLPLLSGDVGVHVAGQPQQFPRLSGRMDTHAPAQAGEEPPPGAWGLSQQVPKPLGDCGPRAGRNAGACAERREWVLGWFGRLRDRLRNVRVCCGDWSRVCASESVTTRLGVTAVFLDPPYSASAGRAKNLYAQDSGTVARDVRDWCLERGADPLMRIALCGYAGEGHEALESAGWSVAAWQARGGYGNRTARGRDNAGRERVWFSPHCHGGRDLFAALEDHAP